MDGKKALNANLDRDVAEFLTDQYPGNVSKIINNLSRAFKDEVQKNPALVADIIHGNISICPKKQNAN